MTEQFNDNPVVLHSVYRKAAFSFFALTALLLLAVAYFILPRAIIVITPAVSKVEYSYVFTVSPAENSAHLADALAGAFLTAEIRQDKTFSASGLETGYKKVTGRVRLINNYSKDQPLVATTRLLNEKGQLFRLKNGIIIPSGGEEIVDIYADNPEEIFSSHATSSHLLIPGLWSGLQDKIYGILEDDIAGEAVSITVVTAEDIAKAKEILRVNTEEIGGNILKQKLVNSQEFDPEQSKQWELAAVRIIQESWDEHLTASGSVASTFQLSGQFILEGIFYSPLEVKEDIDVKIRAKMNENEKIIPDTKGMKVEFLDSDTVEKTGQIYISFLGTSIFEDVNKIVVKSALTGLDIDEATSYLTNLSGVAEAKVELTPWWVKKVPKKNIDIVVLEP